MKQVLKAIDDPMQVVLDLDSFFVLHLVSF